MQYSSGRVVWCLEHCPSGFLLSFRSHLGFGCCVYQSFLLESAAKARERLCRNTVAVCRQTCCCSTTQEPGMQADMAGQTLQPGESRQRMMCLFSPGCITLPGPGLGVTVLAACSLLSGGFTGVNAASGDPVFGSRAGAVAPQRSGGHFPVPQPLCTILVCQGQQQPWSRGN